MKSKLVRQRLFPEDFREDLGTLLGLSDSDLSTVASRLPMLLSLETAAVRISDKEYAPLQEELGLSLRQVISLFAATYFLQRGIQTTADTLEDVVSDLIEIGFIDEADSQRLARYLEKTAEDWKPVFEAIARRVAYERTFPVFKEIFTSAVQVATFEDELPIGVPERQDQPPRVRETTPVVMVSLRISQPDGDEFASFLATVQNLEDIKAELESALRRLKVLSPSGAAAEGEGE
jgi:hypothetical protein